MSIKYEKIESTNNDVMIYLKTGYIDRSGKREYYIAIHGYWCNNDYQPKAFSDVPNNYKTYNLGYVKNDMVDVFKETIEPTIPLFYFNFGSIVYNASTGSTPLTRNSIVIDKINNMLEEIKRKYSTLSETNLDSLSINNLVIIDTNGEFHYFLEEDNIECMHTKEYKKDLDLLRSLSKNLIYHQLDNVTETVLDINNNPGYQYVSSLLNFLKLKNISILDMFYRDEIKIWNITEKPNPLIRFKHLFFMPIYKKENYISVMEYKKDSGKRDDDDDPSSKLSIGRKTAKACFGVIKLKLPKLITEAMNAYSINSTFSTLSAIDLTNLYSPSNIRNTYTMGIASYYKDKDSVLRDMSKNEIIFPIIPSGLATKVYNQMDILYRIIDNYENKIPLDFLKFQDITESFFKDNTCIVPNGTNEWLVKDCQIGTHKKGIYIELGKDILTRNNLKAIEKEQPKVFLVTRSSKQIIEDSNGERHIDDKNCIICYYTLIETKSGIGVYCNFFTSKIIL